MSPSYLKLAHERASQVHANYCQPEQFGYDFRDWVSPYTKSASRVGEIAFVLQDWASETALCSGVNKTIQEFGRDPAVKTNIYLEKLLSRVFGLSLEDVYVTNAFPFVKSGGMSSPIPFRDVVACVKQFAKRELELAQPKVTCALGAVAFRALAANGIAATRLPHPAARIGSVEKHEEIWRSKLCSLNLSPLQRASRFP